MSRQLRSGEHLGDIWPGIFFHGGNDPNEGNYPFDASNWDSFVWELYEWGDQIDPNDIYAGWHRLAVPRPSWAEVEAAIRKLAIFEATQTAEEQMRFSHTVRGKLTDASALPDLGIHVGAGLDHMTGLADMARAAALAGVRLPHIVMRDAAQKRVSVHTTAQLEEILEATRRRENVVESAHNAVMERYHEQARIRDDDSADLDAREAAAGKAKEIAENYRAELEKEIAAYDPDALPADLGELRTVYVERLEARAMTQIRSFRRAVSQQGVDLADACDDEADATRAVALAARNGATAIWSADDAAGAGTAYDAAVAAIEAVVPLNIPEWRVNGAGAVRSGDTAAFAATVPGAGMLTIDVVNPSGTDAEGPLAIYADWTMEDAGGFDPGYSVARKDARITTTIPADASFPVKLTARGRNSCGDSTLIVTVEQA